MAVEDVYRVRMIAEGREGEWNMTFHYQELTEAENGLGTEALASACAISLTPVLVAAMSSSNQVSRWTCDKLGPPKVPGSTFSLLAASRVGLLSDKAMPANSPIVFQLLQTLFTPKSNGQVWMSGVPADKTVGGTMLAAYSDGVVKDIRDNLIVNVEEQPSGDGLWRLVVLSRLFLETDPTNFPGAAAVVVGATHDVNLGMMRSRGFGGRRRLPPKPEEEPPP